jgi:hypothetical protein
MQCNQQRFNVQEMTFVYIAFDADIYDNKLGKKICKSVFSLPTNPK